MLVIHVNKFFTAKYRNIARSRSLIKSRLDYTLLNSTHYGWMNFDSQQKRKIIQNIFPWRTIGRGLYVGIGLDEPG